MFTPSNFAFSYEKLTKIATADGARNITLLTGGQFYKRDSLLTR